MVVQLQGQIFFANATILCNEINSLLIEADGKIHFILLDFTNVLGIDSSAADSLSKLFYICQRHNVKLCYSRGSRKGFPCEAPLSASLIKIQHESVKELPAPSLKEYVGAPIHVADTLDEALCWCEDEIILSVEPALHPSDPYSGRPELQQQPFYFRQFQMMCGSEPVDVVKKLLSYFVPEYLNKGIVLWFQGEMSTKAVLLGEGQLKSYVEGEESTTTEHVQVGALVGEFGLLSSTTRRSTVVASAHSHLFVLHKSAFDDMCRREPYLSYVLARICMVRSILI